MHDSDQNETRTTKHKQDSQDEGVAFYDSPSGGWGSLRGMLEVLKLERPDPAVLKTLYRQNKPGGHMCTSCAWAKPASPHPFEFCENGAKATIWDLTKDRATPETFQKHTVSEMLDWSDHELELTGRLTHPLRYDAATDKYVSCSWESAFEDIGRTLKGLDPKSVATYASGRASLETSYLWALFARLYGHNNLADSSNMCHETTSVGLSKVIGSPVGTCTLDDFDHCDMLLFFGQNTGSNSPRFLHPLQEAAKRGCHIVTFNPVRERGLIKFASPQNPRQMITSTATQISEIYLQVRPGGDIAVLAGLCKRVLEVEDEKGGVLDHDFIKAHTSGFDEFVESIRNTSWDEIIEASGLAQDKVCRVAEIYAKAERTIGIYGMGLTQHVHGFQNLAMYVNLLLLKGNIGRRGAGISPVRGHSNVQGQRTVGISEKTELIPLDKLRDLFGFEPPEEDGLTTVEAVQGVMDGSVKGFISLGGNFARAIPDQSRTDPVWQSLDINVQIATKLNRSHLLVGKSAWLLPCLVRAEEDMQGSGAQAVTMEDSLSHIHGSLGKRTPASKHLKSELAIIAGIAKATLEPNPKVRWDEWTADYSMVRDLIEKTYPDDFRDFNDRLFTPGGFYRGNPARERHWKTDTGKAKFSARDAISALGKIPGKDEYTLITLRSNDQFNTTIYGFSDRLRGLEGSRNIVLMNVDDMAAAGLKEGQTVTLQSAMDDGHERSVAGLKVTAYDLPSRCVGAYYPETNALVPLDYHDIESKTPAYKGAPVRIVATG